MAKNTGKAKKSTKKKNVKAPEESKNKPKETPEDANIRSFFVFILLLLCVTIVIVLIFKVNFQKLKYKKSNLATKKIEQKRFNIKKPVIKTKRTPYEIYPKKEICKKNIKKEKDVERPEIAIIIDDIGFDRHNAEALMHLNIRITLSVLPFTPFGKAIIGNCKNKKVDFMLHLPMQPEEYPKINPGKGALLESMSPDTLISQLNKDINWFPCLKGINNHMGSLLTQDADKINQVFSILKKKNLFFIDSLTSSKSICASSAKLFKMKFARRDIFLDNIQKEKYIINQLDKLYNIALQRGYAIGIGHPYNATVKALRDYVPVLSEKVEFVKASSLVKISME